MEFIRKFGTVDVGRGLVQYKYRTVYQINSPEIDGYMQVQTRNTFFEINSKRYEILKKPDWFRSTFNIHNSASGEIIGGFKLSRSFSGRFKGAMNIYENVYQFSEYESSARNNWNAFRTTAKAKVILESNEHCIFYNYLVEHPIVYSGDAFHNFEGTIDCENQQVAAIAGLFLFESYLLRLSE